MSRVNFELDAELREDMGKGASRRLRHVGKIPAIIYGAGKDPQSLTLSHNQIFHSLEHEAFYSHILTVDIAGDKQPAVLRDVQRHPSKPVIMHIDLLRVDMNKKLHVHVPVHITGGEEAKGVKQGGGLLSHDATDIFIECLPKDLPEFIAVDVTELDLGESIHLSSITLPEGVISLDLARGEDHDLSVVSIHIKRGGGDEEEEVSTEEETPEDGASEE
ncbi:MAG: 50S ribosomal protein L25/general stress protein Ctc [Gammaproteobacteria bacterium]|nr:50S ribosomal protein L25/general stress protein Ctc [Gammaproteobacteria bacterium]